MYTAGQRLNAIIKMRKDVTISSICANTGVSRSTVNRFINDEADITLDKAQKICAEIGISLDSLASNSAQFLTHETGTQPAPKSTDKMQQLMSWWQNTDRTVERIADLLEHVDIYHAPKQTDTTLKVYWLGPKSLSSQEMHNSPNKALLEKFLNSMNKTEKHKVIQEYAQIWRTNQPTAKPQSLQIDLPELGTAYQLNYWRFALPCTDKAGQNLVLNYSFKA